MQTATTIDDILAAFRDGALSAPIALMELLLLVKDTRALTTAIERREPAPGAHRKLLRMLDANREGAERVVRIAHALERQARDPDVDAVRRATRLFDEAIAESEEASVALYSLGSPVILAEATAEVVLLLDSFGCLHREIDVLDIGAGIGRFEQALAPRVRFVHGVDVSLAMVEAAQRRTARLSNVRVDWIAGRDLAMMRDASFDLVLAIDSMPYIVDAGDALVATMFGEIARVLRPGGELVMCGFSYRGDLDRDRADVARHAATHDFTVLVDAAAPFALWDGRVYRLRSSSAAARSQSPMRAFSSGSRNSG